MTRSEHKPDERVDVVTVGEILGAFVSTEPLLDATTFTLHAVGSEVNTLMALGRLGYKTVMGGVLSSDTMGDRLLTQVRGRGVNCDHIRRSPSGNSLIVRNSGENRNVEVLSWRTGLAGSELDQRDITRLPSARYTLITGITAMLGSSAHKAVLELVKKQKKEHSLIVFDPNVRRSLGSQLEWKRVAGDLAAMSDIILAGTDELGLITDNQGARLLLEKGARMVIEKRGRDGATTHLKGSILEATGMPVLVVDPVGAGDAFNAGFLSGLLDEMDTLEAMQRGIKLQSLTVGHIGDTAGHPNRHVLDSTRMDIRR